MSKLVYEIGTIVLVALLYSIPILTACSFIYKWDGFFQLVLIIVSMIEFCGLGDLIADKTDNRKSGRRMKLKTKLSKLRHDGHITDAEYSIIINALNRKPKERVISSVTWSGWKSVTEELPEPLTAVLLTVRYKSTGHWTYQMGYWEETLEKWEKWIEIGTLDDEFDILAWMELPERYEEGRHE